MYSIIQINLQYNSNGLSFEWGRVTTNYKLFAKQEKVMKFLRGDEREIVHGWRSWARLRHRPSRRYNDAVTIKIFRKRAGSACQFQWLQVYNQHIREKLNFRNLIYLLALCWIANVILLHYTRTSTSSIANYDSVSKKLERKIYNTTLFVRYVHYLTK